MNEAPPLGVGFGQVAAEDKAIALTLHHKRGREGDRPSLAGGD